MAMKTLTCGLISTQRTHQVWSMGVGKQTLKHMETERKELNA